MRTTTLACRRVTRKISIVRKSFENVEDCPQWLSDYSSVSVQQCQQCHPPDCIPRWHSGKNLPDSEGDEGSIPALGRSPGVANGNPFQYFWLENSMDRWAWWDHKESDTTEWLTHKMMPIYSQVRDLQIQNHLLRSHLWMSLWDRLVMYSVYSLIYVFSILIYE